MRALLSKAAEAVTKATSAVHTRAAAAAPSSTLSDGGTHEQGSVSCSRAPTAGSQDHPSPPGLDPDYLDGDLMQLDALDGEFNLAAAATMAAAAAVTGAADAASRTGRGNRTRRRGTSQRATGENTGYMYETCVDMVLPPNAASNSHMQPPTSAMRDDPEHADVDGAPLDPAEYWCTRHPAPVLCALVDARRAAGAPLDAAYPGLYAVLRESFRRTVARIEAAGCALGRYERALARRGAAMWGTVRAPDAPPADTDSGAWPRSAVVAALNVRLGAASMLAGAIETDPDAGDARYACAKYVHMHLPLCVHLERAAEYGVGTLPTLVPPPMGVPLTGDEPPDMDDGTRTSVHPECVPRDLVPDSHLSNCESLLPNIVPLMRRCNALTNTTRPPDDPLAHVISKLFPYRCMLRGFSEILVNLMRVNVDLSRLVLRTVHASMSGAYRNASYRPSVRTCAVLLRQFQHALRDPACVDADAVAWCTANPLIVLFSLKEFLCHTVQFSPGLHAQLRGRCGWDHFEALVHNSCNKMRAAIDSTGPATAAAELVAAGHGDTIDTVLRLGDNRMQTVHYVLQNCLDRHEACIQSITPHRDATLFTRELRRASTAVRPHGASPAPDRAVLLYLMNRVPHSEARFDPWILLRYGVPRPLIERLADIECRLHLIDLTPTKTLRAELKALSAQYGAAFDTVMQFARMVTSNARPVLRPLPQHWIRPQLRALRRKWGLDPDDERVPLPPQAGWVSLCMVHGGAPKAFPVRAGWATAQNVPVCGPEDVAISMLTGQVVCAHTRDASTDGKMRRQAHLLNVLTREAAARDTPCALNTPAAAAAAAAARIDDNSSWTCGRVQVLRLNMVGAVLYTEDGAWVLCPQHCGQLVRFYQHMHTADGFWCHACALDPARPADVAVQVRSTTATAETAAETRTASGHPSATADIPLESCSYCGKDITRGATAHRVRVLDDTADQPPLPAGLVPAGTRALDTGVPRLVDKVLCSAHYSAAVCNDVENAASWTRMRREISRLGVSVHGRRGVPMGGRSSRNPTGMR